MSRHQILLRLSAVLAVAAAGCGDGPTDPPYPATVAVTPDMAALTELGSTVQLTAIVWDEKGNPMAGVNVDWTSSDNSVATVDATGLVTATGNGHTEIAAQAGAARGYATVLVEQVPASLEKSEGDGQRALERSVLPVRPTVRLLDANGHPIPIDGASVAFRVTEGGGSVAPGIVYGRSGTGRHGSGRSVPQVPRCLSPRRATPAWSSPPRPSRSAIPTFWPSQPRISPRHTNPSRTPTRSKPWAAAPPTPGS